MGEDAALIMLFLCCPDLCLGQRPPSVLAWPILFLCPNFVHFSRCSGPVVLLTA